MMQQTAQQQQQQQQQQPQNQFDFTNIEEIRDEARRLPKYRKILSIATFLAQQLPQPVITCEGIGRNCGCKPRPVSMFSWFDANQSTSDKRRMSTKSCQIKYEFNHFNELDESELNALLDALIDLEALQRATSDKLAANDTLSVTILRQATGKLIDAINHARFSPENIEQPITKYFKHLQVDASNVGRSSDNPSIKKAFCNFLLQQETRFGKQKHIYYTLGQYFIFYLNNYILKHPTKKIFALRRNEESYRSYYKRWIACVAIPSHIKSFTRYNSTDIFGNEFLTLIFGDFKKFLIQQFASELGNHLRRMLFFDSQLKYIQFTNFINFLEMEFVGHVNAAFWQQQIATNSGDARHSYMTTRTSTIHSNQNELFGNFSSFADMERFVKRIEPLERLFSASALERATHLRLAHLAPHSMTDREVLQYAGCWSGREFCWSRYLLDECSQLMNIDYVAEDVSLSFDSTRRGPNDIRYLAAAAAGCSGDDSVSALQSASNDSFVDSAAAAAACGASYVKRRMVHEKLNLRKLAREPTPDIGSALRYAGKFVLSPKQLRNRNLWNYVNRDVGSSKLHAVLRHVYDEVRRMYHHHHHQQQQQQQQQSQGIVRTSMMSPSAYHDCNSKIGITPTITTGMAPSPTIGQSGSVSGFNSPTYVSNNLHTSSQTSPPPTPPRISFTSATAVAGGKDTTLAFGMTPATSAAHFESLLRQLLTKDDLAREEERKGFIQYRILQNRVMIDGEEMADEDLLALVALVDVIAKQLPRMGKEYISRLVFDPRHLTMAMIKEGQIIGGITFRPFRRLGFTEIVFVAVTASQQVKGYGSRMMNFLKDFHAQMGILHFLTYADANAVMYFVKQGFTHDVRSLPRACYKGHIKEYDGATLMEFKINPMIRYSNFGQRLRLQKAMIAKMIERRQRKTMIKFCFEFTDRSRVMSREFLRQVNTKRIRFGTRSIDFGDHSAEISAKLRKLLAALREHAAAWPFAAPVTDEQSPLYRRLIRFPMDLQTIGKRIEKRYYRNLAMFDQDVRRIFHNCRTFNDVDSDYIRCADCLERFYVEKLAECSLVTTVRKQQQQQQQDN